MDVLGWLALASVAAGLGCVIGSVAAFRRGRLLSTGMGTLLGLLLLSLSALFATIAVGTQGYRALTREELAVTVRTRPTGNQRFEAELTYPDGRQQRFAIAGDQLYIDAHILKWKYIANVLGLHTEYELDRIGGRYREIGAERDSTRTIHSLKADKPIDMFAVRQRFAWLSPLLDTEYGSAGFIGVEDPATFDVMVSTTGLLIRRR